MSFIGQTVGNVFGGAAAKTGTVDSPVQPGQLNTAYDQTQQAFAQQQALLQALQGQNGIANQQNVFNQQQQLANQLQAQSQGAGPNPAQAMLAQNTAANTASQAALMAGQRGASSNAGLIARQAAMQGGANQQAAVGQAATLGANQQIAAQQQLAAQQAQMAGLSSQQVGQQQSATNALTNSALTGQQNLLNAQTANNNTNAQINVGNTQSQNQLVGSLIGATGAGVAAFAKSGAPAAAAAAHGGMINSNATVTGPRSKVGQRLYGGGSVAPAMKSGGPVPGQAAVAGDSPKNDSVHTMLSPGEIVIPRSITMGKDAGKKAAAFVEQVLAKQAMQARGARK